MHWPASFDALTLWLGFCSPGPPYCERFDYLSYVKADGVWYRISDEDVQKVLVSVVQAQTAYMLLYEVYGMQNQNNLHPHFDNSAPSFDGSKHSTTLISPYHYKVSDVNSTTSAQSDPTAQFVSFFEMMTFCGNFTARAVEIYLQTITLVIINQ